MIETRFGPLTAQAEILSWLCKRDAPLQLLAGVCISVICWVAGLTGLAFALPVLLLGLEAVNHHLARPRPEGQEATARDVALLWLSCVVNATAYALPGVALAGMAPTAWVVTGLLWLLGMHVNIAQTWARFPLFALGQTAVVLAMTLCAVLMAARIEHAPSAPYQWWIAGLLVAIYAYNAVETLRRQGQTESALLDAQRSAADRLEMLETLHRKDPLTGLLNRNAFDEALAERLQALDTTGGQLAVVLIDLDSFKPINDTYSHEAGDKVLQEAARRIATVLGEDALIGRLGGDEFICAADIGADEHEALVLAERLQRMIAVPIQWRDRVLKISASIGLSTTLSLQSAGVSDLCQAADQAMFRAKSSPNRQPRLYDPATYAPRMTAGERQHLADALNNGEVRPYYQPKVYLPTGEVIGFEALARWEHPGRGLLMPGKFLDQVDEMGMQGHMLSRIATMVVNDVTRLLDAGLDPGQVSINVPEVALATHTGRDELEQILRANPRVRGHLTFEITEDVFIARAAEAIQASITAFRGLGIRISLDDFGTGFASFHHLRQLDFDELKIDTSFVRSLGHDPAVEVLVQGFLSIASGLGVSVIAEGVETEDHRRQLLNLGCIAAQGFHFAPALPFDAARDLLVRALDGGQTGGLLGGSGGSRAGASGAVPSPAADAPPLAGQAGQGGT